MSRRVAGSWKLLAWRRMEDGAATTYPLGEDATGLLLYTEDGNMAVQMCSAGRPPIDTHDALGGDVNARANAYSTCLAYFGTYEEEGGTIVHHVESSLFPNWSGTIQARPFSLHEDELILKTPPTQGVGGMVVNELSWVRESRTRNR